MAKKKEAPDNNSAPNGKPTPEPAEEKAAEEFIEPDLTAGLQKELNTEKDRYLRLAADYDNYRKRSQREREALFQDVRADTISKLLPVYDNLARALAATCSDEAFYKGVEMTMGQLLEVFDSLGVRKLESVGEKFDPALHNAVMHIEDETAAENTIVAEFQSGFSLGDKIIRHAMVKVAN